MPYTQEQLAAAFSHLKACHTIVGKCPQKPCQVKNETYGDMIYSSGGECTIDLKADIGIVLSALESAKKERDAYAKSIDGWRFRATYAEAYAAKLAMRLWCISGEAEVEWDNAKKEHP